MSKLPIYKVPESAVVNACIKWLWANGVYCWRQNTGAFKPKDSNRFIRYGIPGCADILGVAKGRFIAIECKSARGKTSPLQEAFKKHIEDHGGIYIVARSIDDLEALKGEILA